MARPVFSPPTISNDPSHDLPSPFGTVHVLHREDFSEVAYAVFFTACRSSPGFGARNVQDGGGDGGGSSSPGSPVWKLGAGTAVTGRVRRALGLKTARQAPSSRRTYSYGGSPSSPTIGSSGGWSTSKVGATMPSPGTRLKRQMTAAEIMRQQMRVTEDSENRLRKTLMRTLVGQIGRRAETIILPLELLRHLKPSEFKDPQEYHIWQKRQLKILKAGLLLHPTIPLEKSEATALKLEQIIEVAEAKAIDTGKNSETMRTLCNCVVSLAWRSPDDETTEVCHWADGYPLNAQIYTTLLHAVFDTEDGTLLLDEVDELLELMKKTWSMLGINSSMHNLCFTWKLFEQYIATGQVKPELLRASLAMLTEVANDSKRANKEPIYAKMLVRVLSEIKKFCEKRLLDYHMYFYKETKGLIGDILSLVSSVTKILDGVHLPSYDASLHESKRLLNDQNNIDIYIRSSSRNAFAKIIKDHNRDKGVDVEPEIDTDVLMHLAGQMEELARKEKDIFKPVLRKWHPVAAGVFIATLHACYGELLQQYLSGTSDLTNETIFILQRAGNLEKALMQMILEDSVVECGERGKTIIQEMTRYNVDMVINRLLKEWIDKRLMTGNEILQRAKETETWNPKTKVEPYAQSAAELIQFASDCIKGFFSVPMKVLESLVQDLADGLENLLENYITIVASCGSKQKYVPSLPPLARYRHSTILNLWKRVACNVGFEESAQMALMDEQSHSRPSMSRGTQRLYVRLNTLHYLLSQLHFLNKVLSLPPKASPQRSRSKKQLGSSYFEKTRMAIQVANQRVSEVAAYRLIFLDSLSIIYGSLYVGDVANSRITPALRILKQNITLLCTIVLDRAQPQALKELMEATFEAFLMVLLAGGSSRMFSRLDHPMINEDFVGLKCLFYMCTDGLIGEDDVDTASERVKSIIALMGQSTEQLIEEFNNVTKEATKTGGAIATGWGRGQGLDVPQSMTQWDRSDPTTILSILCHRNDRVANHFLKKTFRLARSTSS